MGSCVYTIIKLRFLCRTQIGQRPNRLHF